MENVCRNTNYAYYLDEVVGFRNIKGDKLSASSRIGNIRFFSFLATLENRPLLEPLICLISQKRKIIRQTFEKSFFHSLSRCFFIFINRKTICHYFHFFRVVHFLIRKNLISFSLSHSIYIFVLYYIYM